MIYSIAHEGSGLGDSLHRYITVRTIAEEKSFDYGMIGDFKGDFFLEQPGSIKVPEPTKDKPLHMFMEKGVYENGVDIRSYDPEINFVEDNTIIDGSFEDSKYWHHNLDNINKWLAVEPLNVPDDLCVVGFRGGEYYSDPKLGLPVSYYTDAANKVIEIKKDRIVRYGDSIMGFEVHTDDPELARKLLQWKVVDNKPISHSKHTNMALNWRSARYAKYAIIPNSAFFILPRLLKHLEDPSAVTIAPRWWARRNTKGPWRPAAYYKEFQYI